MVKKFLRCPVVESKTGLSRSSIYAKIAEDEFPTQVKLGPRAVAWLEEEIDAWIAARIEQSRELPSAEDRRLPSGRNPLRVRSRRRQSATEELDEAIAARASERDGEAA